MEGDSTVPAASQRLEGWQAIGHHFGVSARQAQTWRKELGLPVHGGRPQRVRVWAFTDELDDWRDQPRGAGTCGTEEITKPGGEQAEVRPSLPEAPAHNPALFDSSGPTNGQRVAERPAWNSGAQLVMFAILLLLVGALAGLFVLQPLIARRPESRPAQVDAARVPNWQMQAIHHVDGGTETTWRQSWTDIFWVGPDEGWLSGEISSGGPGGDVGSGILLHTMDRGVSWTPIDSNRLQSGRGTFRWGNNVDTWQDVGPIGALHVYRRNLGGGHWQVEVWFAATTGIYYSKNDGETWMRSTPMPNDRRYTVPYAYFGSLFRIIDADEVYAVGWQGISHWSPIKRAWELQLTALSYDIQAVFAYPGNLREDVWAVGQSGDKSDPYRMIYHLKPGNTWEKFRASGVEIDPATGGLHDLVIIDANTGFAVGPNGAFVKGTKNKDGDWSWAGLHSPTDRSLNSICYADHALWIATDEGTVLRTRDFGRTWQEDSLKDEVGNPAVLRRVRSTDNGLWVVGNRVVYKYRSGLSN